MEIIRRREKVENHQVTIRMPEGFEGKDVEVFVIPVAPKNRRFPSQDRVSLNTKGFKLDRDEIQR
jgi:hypothetical protein